jgi:hypothetical protein
VHADRGGQFVEPPWAFAELDQDPQCPPKALAHHPSGVDLLRH